MPRNIIITGASSGIGKALACQYAGNGITLGLIARNQDRLEETAALCQEKGAEVEILSCDINDHPAISQWMHAFDTRHPVDLVISNAGISGGTGDTGMPENMEDIQRLFQTNVIDAIHVGQCLFENMKDRQSGQIAFTGSIAGFQGWAGAPAYTASKSALHTYVEGLRMLASPYGIHVSIIAPGFVKSPMTERNEFPMPFRISAEKSALIIQKGLLKNKKYIIFPLKMYFFSTFSRILPEKLLNFVARKIKGKS